MNTPTIRINLDAKCDECGKDGRAPNGLCLSCTTRALQDKRMLSSAGQVAQMHIRDKLKSGR
jgi:hypothetical protein